MKKALKTLLHPFEADAIPVPGNGQRVLFLGAEPGFRPPSDFSTDIVAIQGFRPLHLALQREGRTVHPAPEGSDFDAALVLAGRHRGENELRIAEAITRTKPGGLIVVAGSKDDGIASLRKRMDGLAAIDDHLSKYHGVAFWFRRTEAAANAASVLRAANPPTLVEGRFRTAPGMFSHDRIDPASKLLAESLPDNLSGHVADFCAGWGYLAAEVAARCARAKSIDLYEADFASLEAAKANLAEIAVPTRFFWHDLAGEPVSERYDAIVMNPPFHTGRQAEPSLGQAIIKTAAAALKSGGRLFLVANRQLPYERTLADVVSEFKEIAGDRTFKVIAARR
ncbi:class I SAM-dependent methyltransferase [Kumtagia ephedrae]|uniref:Methyltransferase n=1 Tax=Kumtagia ephedrae TaxID=2116701 RepID=A0A2P7RIC8_9HYPH|nr:class I SAM-dependent methyltransferase [Mesorhizobium ephedrae]PSJ49974.1 methyltransferase [Mesorhizobium ephedrae]